MSFRDQLNRISTQKTGGFVVTPDQGYSVTELMAEVQAAQVSCFGDIFVSGIEMVTFCFDVRVFVCFCCVCVCVEEGVTAE